MAKMMRTTTARLGSLDMYIIHVQHVHMFLACEAILIPAGSTNGPARRFVPSP